MDPISAKLRGLTAGALSTSARALSVGSHLMEGLSELLRPRPEEPAGEPAEETESAPSPAAQRRARAAAARAERAEREAEAAAERDVRSRVTQEGPGPVPAPEEAPGTAAEAEPPPTEPVTGVPERARTSETHVEELAGKPAAEVIRAIEGLSTDELERLYSHEQANKQRKTVLAAIERSFAPRGTQR